MSLKDDIRQRAAELGFDACGFARADPPLHGARFQEWLDSGRHGEMAWLPRNADKRLDPTKVLSSAKTVISLALNYHLDTNPAVGPGQGVVARYARFDDYHDVLAAPLRSLADFVNQNVAGTRSLWYVDTGPILERDVAQRAGLGFIGKHTNLISRRYGNWIFLAEILTTLDLEPDTPERNHCGSCRRCLDACPTNAITAPFQLDPRRCISYLTIELKGPIPIDLRPAIGSRIYGCDDCLAVCPWNRFAQSAGLIAQRFRKDLSSPDLLGLLDLDDAGFKAKFSGTPILRTKRRGLLRNVCVALGNIGDRRALPRLERAALDPEPLIAEHARWAIGQIESSTTGNSSQKKTFPDGRPLL
jgi:epoxyqueuosine reductase